MRFGSAAIIFLSLTVFSAFAENKQTQQNPINLIPPITDSNAPFIIDGKNVQTFKEAIVPELLPLVKEGTFPLAIEKELSEKVYFSEGENQQAPITKSGLIREGVTLGGGFIAGNAEEISKEADKNFAGWKLLWNIQSNFWRNPIISGDFSLISIRGDIVGKELGGSFERVYPTRLPEGGKSAQFFREKLIFKSPSSINTLAWLTFRFLGAEEDMLWIYSPAIRKERQLTGSNRSDPVVSASLSLDDLLGWSGKPELVDPTITGEGTYFAPFSSASPIVLKGEISSPCISLKPDDETSEGRFGSWNFQSTKFPYSPKWIPSSGVYVPRDMWIVELTQRDPYSRYGRQLLYVDKELMIPYFKAVYDRTGKLMKLVISYFGYWGKESEGNYSPYSPYALIKDDDRAIVDLFEFTTLSFCKSFPEGKALTDFDPRKLLPVEIPAAG